MSGPKQDLIIYNDNSIISDKVLSSKYSYLSIISHIKGTNPSWLINSLIENATNGTATQVTNESSIKRNRSHVVFISFLQPVDFYHKACKKNGIDLSTMKNFTFIDCFTTLFTDIIKNPTDAMSDVERLFDSITKTLNKITDSKRIVFIENPEILLQASNLSSDDLLKFIFQLNKLCRNLYVISNQDYPSIIDSNNLIPAHPTFKVTDFLTKLYHRSQLNLNLKPLQTGRANDITGCLTITHGCLSYLDNLQVKEQQYIYHLTKDSNVSLYFR